MYKKCPGFFEQKSPKTGKFGCQVKKNPQCPKIGEILGVSKVHLNAGEAGNEDHGSQGLVPVLAVVHLGIHQDPQAGGADHSIKQEGDPADDRAGDGLDQGRQLSDEGADDGKYGRAGDDLDAVYLGDGHNADVLPIGGGGNGADETGQHGGEIISEQTAVESRFL